MGTSHALHEPGVYLWLPCGYPVFQVLLQAGNISHRSLPQRPRAADRSIATQPFCHDSYLGVILSQPGLGIRPLIQWLLSPDGERGLLWGSVVGVLHLLYASVEEKGVMVSFFQQSELSWVAWIAYTVRLHQD